MRQAQAIDGREAAGTRAIAKDLESISHGGLVTVDQLDIERAAQRRRAYSADPTELFGGGAAQVDLDRAACGLRKISTHADEAPFSRTDGAAVGDQFVDRQYSAASGFQQALVGNRRLGEGNRILAVSPGNSGTRSAMIAPGSLAA